MKTKFNAYLTNVLTLQGKTFADVAASPRALKAAKTEAAKQCLADIHSIRAIRIEREKAAREALEAQARLLEMSQAKEIAATAPTAAVVTTSNPNPESPKGIRKVFPVGTTFGLPTDARATFANENYNPTHPMVPNIDPNYVFRYDNVRDVLTFLRLDGERSMFICGPSGCGKTSVLHQIAARIYTPVYDLVGHNRMESPELIGSYKLNNTGGMDFVYGPLTRAAKEGAWFILNEADLLDPATLAGLNGIADGNPFLIPETGELVTPDPNFRFFITANSNGGGDATGRYQGVLQMNLAFVDRFFMTEFTYPEKGVELGILEKIAPKVLPEIRDKMVVFANSIRDLFVRGECEITFSTRTLCRWATTAAFCDANGAPNALEYAFERALAFRAEPSTRQALKELFQRTFTA